MKKIILKKKICRNLLYCLLFSDFLLNKSFSRQSIIAKQITTSFLLETIYSLKLFCRFLFFSKKFCKHFSFVYPDVFYVDILRKICRTKSKLFINFFFSAIAARYDFVTTALSVHLVAIKKFFDVNFSHFLQRQNILLTFGVGSLFISRIPTYTYFLRNLLDDIKKIIFLGIFLKKNLITKFNLKKKLKFLIKLNLKKKIKKNHFRKK